MPSASSTVVPIEAIFVRPIDSVIVAEDSQGKVVAEVSLPDDKDLISLLDIQYSDPEVVSETIGKDQVRSAPVDIYLQNQQTELTGLAEVCLTVSNSETAGDVKNYCLGFIEQMTNPPHWKCQDLCLNERSKTDSRQFCGQTPHFTNFAVLLMGKSDLQRKKKTGACESVSSSYDGYITGYGWGDGLLTALSIIVVFVVVAFVGFIFFMTPCGRKMALGEEGTRIAKLRELQKRSSHSSQSL